MKRLWLSTGGVFLAASVWAATALAQPPAERVYGGDAGGLQGEVEGGASGGVAGGVLPFTGMDLALMVVAAGLLIATGLVIRRVSRSKTVAS
jgi:hypothetical protein